MVAAIYAKFKDSRLEWYSTNNKGKVDVNIAIDHDPININMNTELTTHQLYDISAMLQLETRRGIKFTYDGIEHLVYTNIGILSEPFGSGKTLIILGLIMAKQYPQYILM